MTDSIDRLRTILRLRKRDLDRCEQAAAAARKGVAAAEEREGEAARACTRAAAACEQALAQRLRQPADAMVQLHCRVVAARADSMRRLRDQARDALQEARGAADGMRREWLRAQARHDVISSELERAIRRLQRHISRKADDEARPLGRPVATA